jgi:hypothetical protein
MNFCQDTIKRRLSIYQEGLILSGQLAHHISIPIHHRPHGVRAIGFNDFSEYRKCDPAAGFFLYQGTVLIN